MGLKTEWASFGDSKQHIGYFASPERASSPLPAIVVIQEIWGVDAHIEDVTRRFAAAGYAALAPDLYAHGGARPAALAPARVAELKEFADALTLPVIMDPSAREAELAKKPEPQRTRLNETYAALFGRITSTGIQLDPYVPALLAATRYLREERPETRGQKVGSVGFCMGGGLSALLAASDPELAAAVVFYGSAPSEERIAAIRCPILALYGSVDPRIMAGLPGFVRAMQAASKPFEHHVYEGAQHAFFNDTRPAYDVRAARAAFARTLTFFCEKLA